MFKGVIIYNSIDVHKNISYITWLIESGRVYNLDIRLLVIDKGVNAETLKEISDDNIFIINRSRDWNISYEMEKQYIQVFNNGYFCELGNDKLKGYNFIKEIGIEHATIFKELREVRNDKKIIIKPRNGHGGIGINVMDNIIGELDLKQNIYQEFIYAYKGDIRFYIINNKIIQAVIRKPKGENYLSNFTKGGAVERYNYGIEESKIIEKILSTIHIDYGAIDFLLKNDNTLLFNEFEDAVGSRMLSHLGINNTTDLFLEHIFNKMKGVANDER